MKVIPLPQTEAQQAKKRASLHRATVFYSVAVVVCAVAAILLALGLFVAVIVFEFKDSLKSNLLYILVGSFAGGAWVTALAAFGLNVLGRKHRDAELDFCERCDGQESFYVGEGTLVTFEREGVRIHGERGGREVAVPYKEMRFFSVCTRKKPKESGEWSVVLEIPARYLARGGKAEKGEKPALVQADFKPRLFETLARHNLALLGERPAGYAAENAENAAETAKPAQKSPQKSKFTLLKKFDLPDRAKRKLAVMSLVAGGVLLVGGVLLAVFWQIVVGTLLAAIGFMLSGRAAVNFLGAKGTLGVYEEGLFWRDTNRVDSVFLKWEEIQKLTIEPNNGFALFRAECAYGAYHFPAVGGAEEFLRAKYPEKFGAKQAE